MDFIPVEGSPLSLLLRRDYEVWPCSRGRGRTLGVGQSGFGVLALLGFFTDIEACERLRVLCWGRKVPVQETELRCCPFAWEKGHLPTTNPLECLGFHGPILLEVEGSV